MAEASASAKKKADNRYGVVKKWLYLTRLWTTSRVTGYWEEWGEDSRILALG
jgi:hypothetical protein